MSRTLIGRQARLPPPPRTESQAAAPPYAAAARPPTGRSSAAPDADDNIHASRLAVQDVLQTPDVPGRAVVACERPATTATSHSRISGAIAATADLTSTTITLGGRGWAADGASSEDAHPRSDPRAHGGGRQLSQGPLVHIVRDDSAAGSDACRHG
eukprot:scaffold1044_cov120-Isochrysis_galbana.AAC.8